MSNLAILLSALVAVTSLVIFVWALTGLLVQRFGYENRKINSRLRQLRPLINIQSLNSKSLEVNSKRNAIYEFLDQYQLIQHLRVQLDRTNLNIDADSFVLLMTLIFIGVFVGLKLIGSAFIAAFIGAAIFAALPVLYLKTLIDHRQELLEEQLPNILDFISRGMQAGHTFVSSLQMAAVESPEPIASEFQLTFQEISFGKTIQSAMDDLARRVDCQEMRYFAVAVFINHEVGGNLAALLTSVAQLIRERLKLKLSIHALTGEARTSAWILGALPFVVGLLLFIVRPEFISLLWTDPQGRSMMFYTVVLMLIGIYWMSRLSRIKY